MHTAGRDASTAVDVPRGTTDRGYRSLSMATLTDSGRARRRAQSGNGSCGNGTAMSGQRSRLACSVTVEVTRLSASSVSV